MWNRVSYFDINRRKRVLNESENSVDKYVKQECSKYYELSKRTHRVEDIRKFFNECAQSKETAVDYVRACIDFLEEDGTDELNNIFNSKILPLVENYELNELCSVIQSGNIFNSIMHQIDLNTTCDRVLENYNTLSQKFNIDEYAQEYAKRKGLNVVVEKCCSLVDTYKCPFYGKFLVALETMDYVCDKNNIKFDSLKVAQAIKDYFTITNTISDNDKKVVNNIMNEKYLIEEDMFENNDNSEIIDKINRYAESDLTIIGFDKLYDSIIAADPNDIKRNFGKFLDLIYRILVTDQLYDLSEHIIYDVVPNIYKDLNTEKGTHEDIKEIYKFVKNKVSAKKEIVAYKLTSELDNNDIEKRLNNYYDKLNELEERLEDAYENATTSYNMECMYAFTESMDNLSPSVFRGTSPIISPQRLSIGNRQTVKSHKVFKFDNLVTRTYKVDKYLKNKMINKRDQILTKINQTNKEIFGESSIYDFIDGDGKIDYCVASYYYDPEDLSDLHNEFTKICMEINESIINDPYDYRDDLICYYTVDPDMIQVRLKEDVDLELNEEDKRLVESTISNEDMNRMELIYMISESVDPDYDIIESAKSYFINNPLSKNFEPFIEACKDIGVDKEIITDLYHSILESYKLPDRVSAISRYSSLINNYTPNNNDNIFDILGGYQEACLLTEDAENRMNINDRLKKYGYNGEEENLAKKDNEDDDEEDIPKKKPNRKHNYDDYEDLRNLKRNNTNNTNSNNNQNNNENEDDDDYEDVHKEGPRPRRFANNMKLAGKAVQGASAHFYGKEQRAEKLADAAVERFVRNCKRALVSDRREAIIKGSVIPSFSRCIKILIVLAGIGAAVGIAGGTAFSFPAAIISALVGLATSKNLTKKERVLLLDEIETELKVIDKELQIADSNNQMNKYRALLKMKKDLERQYQRIKVNLRVGKDLLPSGVAVPTTDEG